ncbi:uncharacterized protein LOC128776459 [Panthera pardus]|uniref:Uncharacterized protein LOC128776459 n=1 Tax=Panthera pardus TaxID=9691 RepID=A0A9W2VDH8_PANPR|nr:uncharacterized protein LOC128776459 [Panthera pardus]
MTVGMQSNIDITDFNDWLSRGITFGGPTEISPEPTRLLVNGSYLIPIGKEGHLDQIPYILVWQDLVENPPPWMASSLIAESCQILVAKPINPPKPPTPTAPPVLPDNQDLLSLDPPPYQIPPLIPKAAPIPAAPAEPPVAQPIGELENREAQPAPKPSGGKVQGLPDIPVGGPHMSQDSAFLTPPVTLQVEGNPVQFLVDTGAQHSVLIRPHGKISKKSSWVQGATGIKKYPWTTQRTMDLGNGKVTHSFLVIPDSPCPLLGRDLLTKMEAQIHFTPGGPQVTGPHNQPITTLTLRLEDEYRLQQGPPSQSQNIEPWLQQFPGAWAETGGMGLAKHRPALFIELKPGADPVRVRQYPMSMEARNGITPHIRRLLDLGILRPCHSAWNTPLLPVRKPNSADYRPVQDLREVNRRVMDIHPTVPNPYTLLSALSPERQWYTVLDLKDAFFSLPLAPKSQELFAFEWSNPERGINGQLTWTRLPQGFKNSPTLFDEALHEDLGEYRNQNPKVTLLQYVDDLLIAAETAEACLQGTKNLLRTLGALGYRASAKKAQICRSEVTYLGYLLREGQRWLTDARKETVLRIPRPTTRRQTRTWIPPSMTALRYWHRFMEFGKIYRITRCQTPRLPGSLTAAALYIKVKGTWGQQSQLKLRLFGQSLCQLAPLPNELNLWP